VPKARAYTRVSYLSERRKFVDSMRLDAFTLRSDLIDLLLVILCEIAESGHPVYLIVDDEKIPAMVALGHLLNELFDLVCERLKQSHDLMAAVMLVPASACAATHPREAAL
jgi:hypothetical protein